MSDDDLIEQIRDGDEGAADALIRRYYGSILRYCRWHCSNAEKAEDLTQETFFKLFRNLWQYEGKKKFKAYLYSIASHLCIDESRKMSFLSLEEEADLANGRDEMRQVEDNALIGHLLQFLSPEQKEAVILRFGGQLSYAEIAKVTGENMRTAQSRVRTALKIMRASCHGQ